MKCQNFLKVYKNNKDSKRRKIWKGKYGSCTHYIKKAGQLQSASSLKPAQYDLVERIVESRGDGDKTWKGQTAVGDKMSWDTVQNWAFYVLLTSKGEVIAFPPPSPPSKVVLMFELPRENNKHPNFEWRGQGRGTDSFVLLSYPIWVQCLNNFVADCRNLSGTVGRYNGTMKMRTVFIYFTIKTMPCSLNTSGSFALLIIIIIIITLFV